MGEKLSQQSGENESVELAHEKTPIEKVESRYRLSLKILLTVFIGSAVLILGVSWLLFDEQLENFVQEYVFGRQLSAGVYSLVAICILASDLLLPIPSSGIITHAGIRLGIFGGTVVGFCGITIGSLIGYLVVRSLGESFLASRVSNSDRIWLEQCTRRYGVLAIVLLRPVPILAEASILVLALGRMAFSTFLIWLSISNFCVALFFAAFGNWANDLGLGEFVSVILAILFPAILLLVTRIVFNRVKKKQLNEC